MRTNVGLLITLMLMNVLPVFARGGWNNMTPTSNYGSQKPSQTFVNTEALKSEIVAPAAYAPGTYTEDWENGTAVGEEPILDDWRMIAFASLLYGIYLLCKQKRKRLC
ncbi:MAG: hypothetical protein LBN18_06975 [Dysgonamonadaceae bacterium]|jgi:hypothetical protein|nr:hypothetical protein [Dysgonamonadaceae bacterium]